MITPKTNTVFETKEYNVTDQGCQLLCCLTCPLHFLPVIPGTMGSKRMVLEEEEAVLMINCPPCCSINTRRPYGELGSVDKNNCLCCKGVSSDLNKSFPLFVGWGCDDAKVTEIVSELKARMKARGDTGQIERAEETLSEVKHLREEVSSLKADMKLLMQHLNVPVQYEMER